MKCPKKMIGWGYSELRPRGQKAEDFGSGRSLPEPKTGMLGLFEYQQAQELNKHGIDVDYMFGDIPDQYSGFGRIILLMK